MTRVGVLGLGAMGGAVAARLVETGLVPLVHDVDEAAVARAVAAGAVAAGADRIGDVELLITSLPDDGVLVDAAGDADLLRALSGGVLVDLSTVLPETARDLARRASGHGVAFVDAPVSGGPMEARAGTLVLFVGGDDADIDRVAPVLDLLGTVERVGAVGDGKAIKLVNNVMATGNALVAAEAFSLGERLGLEPRRMFDVLSRSGGRSHHFLKRMPWVLDDDFSPRFAIRLAEKDLRLALETARGAGLGMPIAGAAQRAYREGIDRGMGGDDMIAVIKLYREQTRSGS